MDRVCDSVRTVVLVGPGGAGKTSLTEALLFAAGAINRQGSVEAGTCVGDASPEARARRASTEPNFTRFDFLGDSFCLIDTPGSVGFASSGAAALPAADLALVVVDPDPARAALAEPALRQLEALDIPHAVFVNRIDQARGSIQVLLEALQPMSATPLLARQLPIREGDTITGFVDLALERAFHYRPGKPSEQIDIPAELAPREAQERLHMLEQLADHDDALLEALISDETPSLSTVLADLSDELARGQVVPVLFGSAANGFGIRRLLKLLRHETPHPAVAAARLGATGTGAYAFRVSHAGAMGRLAFARVFGGSIGEGSDFTTSDGVTLRAGALFQVQGAATTRTAKAQPGEIVAIGKADAVHAGQLLRVGARPDAPPPLPGLPEANAALAITTRDRKDDVRLSAALNKLAEEDPSLRWAQDEALHETVLRGVNDEHLAVTLDRLKARYGVAVETGRPGTAYREAVRNKVSQHGRHKKQSGGHGQFGDVTIEVQPLARGGGFEFVSRIIGGAVPKQWIPAVELGVRDAMAKGPLGFPVVDVAVALTDGAFHSVDSSELAFRTAGRIAMAALAALLMVIGV
ncbi:MAG TPA: elongation factor G, partial [Polymorphobacter sp.]|nr:elongation factor G [Polymorphobacter sp.]